MATPVTSLGNRSLVNWMRENAQSMDRAIEYARVVLPTPGKSSISRCPPATRQTITWLMTSSFPRIDSRMLARRRSNACFAPAIWLFWTKSLIASAYHETHETHENKSAVGGEDGPDVGCEVS